LQKILFLLFEPLDALKGLPVYPIHPVGHEESLGTLADKKLAADPQGQQVHIAAVQLEDIPSAPLKLQRANPGVTQHTLRKNAQGISRVSENIGRVPEGFVRLAGKEKPFGIASRYREGRSGPPRDNAA
jgi:hypothetical protein